jgi:hypothetical protein
MTGRHTGQVDSMTLEPKNAPARSKVSECNLAEWDARLDHFERGRVGRGVQRTFLCLLAWHFS